MTKHPNKLRRDYTASEKKRRDADVAKFLDKQGLLKVRTSASGRPRLPISVSQSHVAKERSLFNSTAGKRFRTALKKGRPIYFVTVIDPAWAVKCGKLAPRHFKAVKDRIQRRARNLINSGPNFVAGIVDLSLNDQTSVGGTRYWQPHAHFLVHLRVRKSGTVMKTLRAVFRPFGLSNASVGGTRPILVQKLETLRDLRRVQEYVTSKLLADCQQRRISYRDNAGIRNSRAVTLRREENREFLATLLKMQPRQRWILSGLRRDGNSVRRLRQVASRKDPK